MEPSDLRRLLVRTLEALHLDYLVTGSMATIAYGEPRLTNDLDVVVALPIALVDRFCDAFPMGDFYLSRDAVRDAVLRSHQFNIIHFASGLKIDVIIPADDDFERSRKRRGRAGRGPRLGSPVRLAGGCHPAEAPVFP